MIFVCHITECGNVCVMCRLATKSLFNLYMKPPANPQQYNHIASYKHGYELTPLLFLFDYHLYICSLTKALKFSSYEHNILDISNAPNNITLLSFSPFVSPTCWAIRIHVFCTRISVALKSCLHSYEVCWRRWDRHLCNFWPIGDARLRRRTRSGCPRLIADSFLGINIKGHGHLCIRRGAHSTQSRGQTRASRLTFIRVGIF